MHDRKSGTYTEYAISWIVSFHVLATLSQPRKQSSQSRQLNIPGNTRERRGQAERELLLAEKQLPL